MVSRSGPLAVPEEASTLAMQSAIDAINKSGGVAGHPIQPVIVDAKPDFSLYAEKAEERIIREKVTPPPR
ncbi:transporter substrate-binding protein [Methylobacterium sp. Leaf123]|uniref:transporter substrate-binding protein n=1 Tax=Methylobacterium sp. Leaf123 TaxID=1736264 RepID=UPI0025702A7E|nr:transporter substrate-binding protein [Methylobacterium sp. Leaf123]